MSRLASTRFASVLSAFLLVGVASPLAAQQAAAPATSPAPKLIVAISVDQLSADLFARYRGRVTGGFARLAQG